MNNDDGRKLQSLICQSIEQGYQQIQKLLGDNRIYVFAIGLMRELSGFACAANTVENLHKNIAQEEGDHSPELVWSIVEWPYLFGCHEQLDGLINDLVADCDDDTEECLSYRALRENYEAFLIQALAKLDEKGLFSRHSGQYLPIIFIQYIEDYEGRLSAESLQMLNSPIVYQLFVDRYQKDSIDRLMKL